ncbi:TylF/MycF family methyltransferase [Candidatus Saccharibacteria bacterium]|nr:TylF/MycF family methyltransferase [Candidatus Saccharibacteria bacterium]MCL1963376.1 TylF/MycF family methyltransferase [Candidatus Saccharibacteria bacterium]
MIDELLKRHRLISDQVDEKELRVILRELLAVLDYNVLGDVVEFGCYKGTTSLFLARVLESLRGEHSSTKQSHGTSQSRLLRSARNDEENEGLAVSERFASLFLYDSFAGLPEKTALDNSRVGEQFVAGELLATKSELLKNFRRENLPMPIIKKSWFCDLTAADVPHEICFAFFDGDFYESIRDSFRVCNPYFSPGATIVIDDYQNEALPGASKAADEWLRQNSTRIKSFRVERSLGIIKIS